MPQFPKNLSQTTPSHSALEITVSKVLYFTPGAMALAEVQLGVGSQSHPRHPTVFVPLEGGA